jgi:hypothetical protein
VLLTASVFAQPNAFLFRQPDASSPPAAKVGWEKVELTWADRTVSPIPLSAVTSAGAEDVADYGTYRIIYVPAGAVKTLAARLAGQGIRVRERDDLDRIDTPGARIDARLGIDPSTPVSGLTREYPPKKNGLYLLQLVGPAKAEWYKALLELGWSVIRYIPSDAYVVVGPPELVSQTRLLPFVQFFDFYHPFQKGASHAGDGGARQFLFVMPSIDGRKEAIDTIAALAVAGSLRVENYENDTYVHARMKETDANSLLALPLVIGVSIESEPRMSDERQAMSLSANVTAAGSQPTNPETYSSWLASHCSQCTAANMPSDVWRVGTVDSGLDGGSQGDHHPDLAGREYWGTVFRDAATECPPLNDCDDNVHGTMVAGIIAGNATVGSTDNLGFYYGTGIAPMAGVFSTKIFGTSGFLRPLKTVFDWAQDAASHSVTIQNHSNNYPLGPGNYTQESRDLDLATRDADNDSSNGRIPMLFTVSSANWTDYAGQPPYQPLPPDSPTAYTHPPATAKNVIAVGGVENYRPDLNGVPCGHGSQADDFRNIMFESAHGTSMPGYIKPDLVAPGSYIVSTRSRWNPMSAHPTCTENAAGDANWYYSMWSGTSFAAPVAAGAAILIKRYLGSSPTTVSPAGVKAVLIAGARSIRDGLDRSATPSVAVGAAPNTRQGFGRLSLDSILTGATPPVLIDQSFGRHFTASGQARTTRLTVRDPSKPVVVALVWTDYPATPPVTSGSPLVNDLDLTIFPIAAPCTYRQGNYLSVSNASRGEESVSTPCNQTGTVDRVNNVEYARFFADGFTEFDVKVDATNIAKAADPGYPADPNQDFALVVLNADLVNGGLPIAPQLTAARDAVTAGTVHLSWTEPLNMIVDHYEVRRGSSLAGFSTVYPNEHGTTKDDVGLAPGVHTWVYEVTAVGTSATAVSNTSIATTITFDDDPITPFFTPIRARHAEQLREAIDAIRFAAGLTATNWIDGTSLLGVVVKSQHVTQMQSQLDAALAQLTQSSSPYTALGAYIKAQDFGELRAHVK